MITAQRSGRSELYPLLALMLGCDPVPADLGSPAPASTPASDAPGTPDHGASAPNTARPHESLDPFADAYRAALKRRGDPPCTWQHETATPRCSDGRQHDLRGLWAEIEAAADKPARAQALLDLDAWAEPPSTLAGAAPFLHLRATPHPDGLSRPVASDQPAGLAWQLELGAAGGHPSGER